MTSVVPGEGVLDLELGSELRLPGKVLDEISAGLVHRAELELLLICGEAGRENILDLAPPMARLREDVLSD